MKEFKLLFLSVNSRKKKRKSGNIADVIFGRKINRKLDGQEITLRDIMKKVADRF